MTRTGVGIVGVGGWGKNLLRNFAALPDVDLLYACDQDPNARARASQQVDPDRVVADFDAVLRDPRVQAVVIATDAKTHFELGRRALEAGKDVFVEKPLALSTEHANALDELARGAQRILMVGHLLLYHPAIGTLQRLIADGQLGEIQYIYSQRLNLGVVRRDENAWWSLAPHDVSVANVLLGGHPVAVSATGGTFVQPGSKVQDVVFGTLLYPDGKLAHIHVSWLDPHKIRRLTVVGSKKMAVFDDTSPDMKLTLYDKGVEISDAISYEQGVRIRTGDILIPALRMEEPLRRECQAFIDAVRTREAPVADGTSGAAVVGVLEAGERSLRHGGAPVRVGDAT